MALVSLIVFHIGNGSINRVNFIKKMKVDRQEIESLVFQRIGNDFLDGLDIG
jgi:hypothetical protein